MRSLALAAIVLGTAIPLLSAQSSAPSLELILQRVDHYVAEYQKGLRGIVAEEDYVQNVTRRSTALATRGRWVREGRRIKSDLLFVKLGAEERWMQFRDTFEVDRRPVRDRDQRLYKLFVDPKPDSQAQAEAIQLESARYNLGPVMRTINVPMLGLYFFDRSFIVGVEYSLGKPGNVKKFGDLAKTGSISVVEFKETTKETAIRGEYGREVPSHGKAYIDHANGRILQTELISQDQSLVSTIFVTYKAEPGLPILVPKEMREIYTMPRSDTRIDGRATYGRFRQFTVTTTEKPKP